MVDECVHENCILQFRVELRRSFVSFYIYSYICLYIFIQNVEATFKLEDDGLLREICVLQFYYFLFYHFLLLLRIIFSGEVECRRLLVRLSRRLLN